MFGTFFRFELRFWLRGLMVYVFLFIIGLMIFGAVSSDNVQVGGSMENSNRNAPYVIQNYYAVMAILTCLMTAAFVNGAASRDFTYNTHQIVFSKPLDKFGFLMGRFWGAALISVIPMLGVSLGVILAKWMPWVEPDQWGPISWGAHAWSIVIFAIPNAIFVSAIVFAIAVWTRSTMAAFLGPLLLLVGYSIAETAIGNLDNETLSAMIDPFGASTFSLQTKYWTVSDRNTQYLTLTGLLLWNRLLWLTVGMSILAVSYWRFSFAERTGRSKRRTNDATIESAVHVNLPTVSYRHGPGTYLRQLWSQIKVDFLGILKSNVFIVIMVAALLNSGVGLYLSSTAGFGLSALPVTYEMVDIIRGTLYVFLLGVITFYAGVLVWKEREASLDEVYDALPHPNWIVYLGKLVALMTIVFCILFVGMIAGIITQALNGYDRFQLELYAQELLGFDLLRMFFLVVLAMFAHVMSPNKYIGYFSFIILVIANSLGWRLLHIETRMVRYGGLPGYTYSDLFKIAPFVKALAWFSVYWTLFAGLVSIAAILFWQRGRETTYASRAATAWSRLRGAVLITSLVAVVAWAISAGFVYHNTKVVNTYLTSQQQIKSQADYETRFKEFESKPHPRVTQVRYTIDVYPEKRGLRLHGDQTIVNKSDAPIEEVFVMMTDGYENELAITGATLAEDYPDFDCQVHKFDPPLAPGDSTQMSYTVSYEAEGFENSVSKTEIVQNGTFFNNGIVPQLGYQPRAELTNKKDRKKHDLGPPAVMPPLEPDNLIARSNTYISNNSDWVDVETVISTSSDQIAIAPGSLLKAWEEDGRRYFHYKVDHPSLNFYSFISAKYEVARRKWKGVDIEVYYHPEHHWNVDNMLRSIRQSLEYYTEQFGPYRHKQARIIEFPRVASFAQAFPGTMPYSEGIGFIADIKEEDDIDMVFYVVAHEMAHQWWAHQVIGANMEGATMLSETLAQYSALMVMEKEFGRDIMRKFLKYEMDNYLRSRGRELLDEKPLWKVDSNQGYIHYRKGSVVMYYLKEMIGEENVNAALTQLVDRFGYVEAPYPTSADLVDALQEQTPAELHYLIDDLFREITLFANRVLEATYAEREDGKFDITLKVRCEKFQADEEGNETELSLDDWIEIGAFAAPEKGKKYGRTLHRERVKITENESTFEFVLDEKPDKVGIDPFSLLIDRIPDDNVKKPKMRVGDEATF